MKAYLVLVTWADGTEGLLFPRPGHVPIAGTLEQGAADYEIAKEHLAEYLNHCVASHAMSEPPPTPVSVRLVEFERGPELACFTVE